MNKAQRIFWSLVAFIVLGVLPVETYARAVLPSAGLLPGNPLYVFDKLAEKMQVFFTFKPEQKALVRLGFAEERISEIKTLLAKGDIGSSEINVARASFDEDITQAADIVSQSKINPEALKKVAQRAQIQVGILNEAFFEYSTIKAEQGILAIAAQIKWIEDQTMDAENIPLELRLELFRLKLELATHYQAMFLQEETQAIMASGMQELVFSKLNNLLSLESFQSEAIMSTKEKKNTETLHSSVRLILECQK